MILEKWSKQDEEGPKQVKINRCMEMIGMDRMYIDDILHASTPILIDKIDYHPSGPLPMKDNVDINTYKQFEYLNLYTSFL